MEERKKVRRTHEQGEKAEVEFDNETGPQS